MWQKGTVTTIQCEPCNVVQYNTIIYAISIYKVPCSSIWWTPEKLLKQGNNCTITQLSYSIPYTEWIWETDKKSIAKPRVAPWFDEKQGIFLRTCLGENSVKKRIVWKMNNSISWPTNDRQYISIKYPYIDKIIYLYSQCRNISIRIAGLGYTILQ